MNSDEKHLIVKRTSIAILVDVLRLGKCLILKFLKNQKMLGFVWTKKKAK